MKIKPIIFSLLSLAATSSLRAQDRLVRGVVLNDKNEPVSGATIVEAGNERNGTSTDGEGHFQLLLKGKSGRISVSYIGFLSKEVGASSAAPNAITLAPDTKGLEDVVVVAYGRQKRITSTGAISSIKGEEIRTVPTASVQNALVGRLPGFFAQQRSGQPGSDAADFFIRGVNSLNGDSRPLIIVDDIEYDYTQLAQLNANEIESITILKDAATTSIYGLKGANGVLVVTTSRGRIGKPRINLTTEAGFNKVIRMPTLMDAYTTALLRNEGVLNDAYGLSQSPVMPFSPDDLKKFRDGSDPYGHANVNWMEELLHKGSGQGRVNVDVSGGNKMVKYFTSLGYYTQNGILKQFDPVGDYVNTNYFYRRYNYRSNLDITPTKTLKLRFDINGRFEAVNNPAGSTGLFSELSTYAALAPYAMPVVNPNGTYGYGLHPGANGTVNPVYRMANSGYRRDFKNNYNVVVGADQKLDFITQGLLARVNVSYAGNTNETRSLTRGGLPAYKYDPNTNTYAIQGGFRMPVYGVGASNSAFNATAIFQASLNYDRTFHKTHHINTLLLVNQRNYINGGVLPNNYRGLTGRLDYDYKRKYLLGFTLARNGNDLFRKEQRFGIFPAVSWGYNLSEERFFKQLFPFFDLFKIRGSYGFVGSDYALQDAIAKGLYNPAQSKVPFSSGSNYYGVTTFEGTLVNPLVTWERERKTDLGLEANLLDGRITLSGSYFDNYRFDQLIRPGDVPLLLGQSGNSLPLQNLGKTENKGFDGVITYKDKIGKLAYSLSGNASYAVNKITYVSEAPDYPYQARTGTRIGLSQGYHWVGYYTPADFDAAGKVAKGVAVPQGLVVQPGDLKYADFNNDGVINDADKTYLSKPNLPSANYGLELSVSYKNFSIRALLQGAFGYAVQITGEGAGDAFAGNLRPWQLERWTPTSAATATYPRMGLNTNAFNSSTLTVSDFWFTDAGYVRLKSLDVGYQLPQSWLKRTRVVQHARVYASGYNLLNINRMGHFLQDAEVSSGNGGAYPNTANFNLGLQLGF